MYNPAKPVKKSVIDLIKTTWNSPYLELTPSIYAIFKQTHHMYEVDHTDGIGTKGNYHWKYRTFKHAVTDILAMNLNDLALVGARAYKLQNHIVLPADDDAAVIDIVSAMVEECVKRQIVITGGETSIHNNADGMDISMTVSGLIEKPFTNVCRKGDVVIGLASNGLHSNGMTKVREVLGDDLPVAVTEPTLIYADRVLKALDTCKIHGMMHITGGAYTKLKDLLGNNNIVFSKGHSLTPQAIFFELYNKGISDKDMYTTFNCGIGFIITAPKTEVAAILKIVDGVIVGEVTSGNGKVIIPSAFSNEQIIL
ncbi:MAG: hypothetical protein RI947_250 [Candidatus Parcubacteria bacterium]|jgi:phosphoribosylformylglycinamidine cyclo-ligase